MTDNATSVLDAKYLEFFASCPEGFESALDAELRSMGLRKTRPLKGRVTFTGTVQDAERACLWSRLASRIFVVLDRFSCWDANELYRGTYDLPWESILKPGASIAVTARGSNRELRNSHYAALCVKDAVCDRLADEAGTRADVDTQDPDARIALSIRGERATLSLDLTGEPLFKRLPREATRSGAAAHVLRPDYAALTLAQASWQQICDKAQVNIGDAVADAAGPGSLEGDQGPQGETPTFPLLLDLCCAGGGIVLEAAGILADRAPNLERKRWGFLSWTRHDPAAWAELVNQALTREELAADRAARIIATDISGDAVSLARRVLKAAHLDGRVIFAQPDAQKIARKLNIPAACSDNVRGAMVLDTTDVALTKLPRVFDLAGDLRSGDCVPGDFGQLVGNILRGLPLVDVTRNALAQPVAQDPVVKLDIMPNNEEASILVFAASGANVDGQDGSDGATDGTGAPAHTIDLGDGTSVPVQVPESDQFAARLKKVARLRRKWAKRAGVSCYRVYDADLPDYAAAIDLYQGGAASPGRWLVVAEYAAPKSIDPQLAQARLLDILAIAPRVLDVKPEHVYAKARTRSRGGSQYAKQDGKGAAAAAPASARKLPLIEEGGLTFAVNFDDYLDTGIFLDHRVTRGMVRERAQHARSFLNLFAYTGTATCYAADAGVAETVTVDLSNTYLNWAERNMELNGFTGRNHHFVRADVLRWIREQRETRNRWDLIFCDPPTFSNSSKMGQRTWDVQRDHVELLIGVSRLLTREGEAIFSCNLRSFKPDTQELARAGVVLEDISAETIPEDFARNQKIHRCYLVRRCEIEYAMELAGFDRDAIMERRLQLRDK